MTLKAMPTSSLLIVVNATIQPGVGIVYEKTTRGLQGRGCRLTDVHGMAVKEDPVHQSRITSRLDVRG